MDLELDTKDLALQSNWRAFADGKLAPFAEEVDRTGSIPQELIDSIADSDLLQPFLPKNLGGEGLDLMHLVILLEELARQIPSVAWFAANQVVLGIRANQKAFNLPEKDGLAQRAARGEAVFALAASEMEAGCDLAGISTVTTALSDGSHEISGEKSFVNWAGRATFFLVLARTSEPGGTGSTIFLVPSSLEGVSVGAPHLLHGLQGLETAPVKISRAVVPAGNTAGVVSFGLDLYDRFVNELRICLSAICTGIAQRAYTEAYAHARSRKQFGKPVGSFQSIQWRFADAALQVEASRLHVWQAVEMAQDKTSCFSQAAMAKVFSAECASWVTGFAVQVLGGRGLVKPHPVERMFRDARFFQIGLGTMEILRSKIAEHL